MINKFINSIIDNLKFKNGHQLEFIQAVKEVLSSLKTYIQENAYIIKSGILERIIIPERLIEFRVAYQKDDTTIDVNTGYRVQFNSALGPYKGGLRFHPSVNPSIIKFLGFEQIFKNSLTGLPLGGGKGGSDFNPKGKSDGEIMRFCQSFMTELSKYIGPNTDIPAGDIGVGEREIGYMFGQYKRIKSEFTGILTGKSLEFGGSLVRKQATGYGLLYFTKEMLENINKQDIKDKKIVISGSGNVAIYAAEKAIQMGACVVAMSDSSGFIYAKNGIILSHIISIKEVNRQRISEYINLDNSAEFYPTSEKSIWSIPCDIALPCATQNELSINDAKILIKNGVIAVAEGANMPCCEQAVHLFLENNISFAPGKAANAGGVATSGLEMSQNSIRDSWNFETVDKKLETIMKNIFKSSNDTSIKYNHHNNLVIGSNIAGFHKVATAMAKQGIL
ncbi:MAG: NADP-specific glutamate dehydrogenase [Oscillospiraceae bacterium]|nr:NADP-specific glutamate dehydrogenase [Oscillospiraceae bacterium]